MFRHSRTCRWMYCLPALHLLLFVLGVMGVIQDLDQDQAVGMGPGAVALSGRT